METFKFETNPTQFIDPALVAARIIEATCPPIFEVSFSIRGIADRLPSKVQITGEREEVSRILEKMVDALS